MEKLFELGKYWIGTISKSQRYYIISNDSHLKIYTFENEEVYKLLIRHIEKIFISQDDKYLFFTTPGTNYLNKCDLKTFECTKVSRHFRRSSTIHQILDYDEGKIIYYQSYFKDEDLRYLIVIYDYIHDESKVYDNWGDAYLIEYLLEFNHNYYIIYTDKNRTTPRPRDKVMLFKDGKFLKTEYEFSVQDMREIISSPYSNRYLVLSPRGIDVGGYDPGRYRLWDNKTKQIVYEVQEEAKLRINTSGGLIQNEKKELIMYYSDKENLYFYNINKKEIEKIYPITANLIHIADKHNMIFVGTEDKKLAPALMVYKY